MEGTCKKCGKAFVSQRKTRQFCNDNCRSIHGQQVRRGKTVAHPLSATEVYLLETVLEVGALTTSIWAEMRQGTRLSIANIEKMGRCSGIAQGELIQGLRKRYEQQVRLAGKWVDPLDEEVP